MSIRIRAILVIVSTNAIIILLSILAGIGYVGENIDNYIEADMMVVADIADRFISSELDMLRDEAGEAAENLAYASASERSVILAEQLRLYPKFIGMAVLNRSAGAAASAGESPASSALLENEFIKKAFSGETSFTSTVPSGDGVAFYLAAPIAGTSDDVLVLTLSGTYFSGLASEYHVWDTGHIFIDDSEGYIIANIRPEWVRNRLNFILEAQADPQLEPVASVVQKLTAGERGIGYYSMNGVSRICAYRPISGSREGWRLGIVAPLSESPVRNLDRGLLVGGAVAFLLNVAAAVVASNFIRKPFEEVTALQAAAEASSAAKTSFLAHMSHEIRTPLNAVVGLSELALGNERLDGDTEDKLETIHSSGMTILSIVNDILDISKIESGKFELYPAQYDTPSLINDIVTLNIVRIGEKLINFRLEIDENLPGSLYGDDLRVKQIFNNLLSNAFKYTEAGTVEWKLTFNRDADGVEIISGVRDTGIGIKPENLQRLFSDYNRVDIKANRRVEGTGLGLAISKRLLEMMGGSISVESEYGKGSMFSVRLRQGPVSDTPIGAAVAGSLMNMRYAVSKRAGQMKAARDNLSYAHVLVVDDVATNLDVVKGMMKPYGVKIDCALSGPRAIEMIRAGSPVYKAVFMDHMMPGMDGIEATQIIRGEIGTDYARNIPIIALTANAIVGNEEMFLAHGFQDFISKPIDMAKLDAVLRRWVKDKKLEKEQDEKEELSKGSADILNIEGVDTQRALRRFSGDAAVLTGILRSYSSHTRPLLRRLREYLGAENLTDYRITVHGIKGSSREIFAEEAGQSAEALEASAKAGNLAAVRAGHPAFVKLVEAVLEGIDRALGDTVSASGPASDSDSKKPLAERPDPALLKELREACEAFDMDRVDRAMAQLTSFRYERGGELVAWLREQADNMSFEAISGGDW